MKRIKIAYRNFWNAVDPLDGEYFLRMFPALRGDYEFETTTRNPDFVLYSVYGYVNPEEFKGATRILISCEGGGNHFAQGGKLSPTENDPNFFHYGLTCWWDSDTLGVSKNHYYMPPPLINVNLYNGGVWRALKERQIPQPKTKFCNFIYGNGNSMDRRKFKDMLALRKHVDCPGPVDTNTAQIRFTGYNKESYLIKQMYQKYCKFSIAFENCYSPGYTTEKLSDPLIARSVPIYFGNPEVNYLFNPQCFIHVRKYGSSEEAIEYILRVDEHPELYEEYLYAPVFPGDRIPYLWDDQHYAMFWKKVFG